MAKTSPFEKHACEYEQWFEGYHYAYESELAAISSLLPGEGAGLEVGMGTGRFALPLGIRLGVEPARAMGAAARAKGLGVVSGVAEALPFPDQQFDYILFVTVDCFLDSVAQAFKEAFRVIRPGGAVVIGFIDKDSFLGLEFEQRKNDSSFYRQAEFHSVAELEHSLAEAGFGDFTFVETIFQPLAEIAAREPIKEGCDQGAFVVIRATR